MTSHTQNFSSLFLSSIPTPYEMMTLIDTTESKRKINQTLSNYLTTIQRSDFLDLINLKLRRNHCLKASDLEEHYSARPELKRFTLDVEMDRIDYDLILPDGQCIDDKDTIRAYFHTADKQPQPKQDVEILVRAANQSLFADAIGILTSPEKVYDNVCAAESFITKYFDDNASQDQQENQIDKTCFILSGHQINMSPVAEKCHITIDLQRGSVSAICVLATSIPAIALTRSEKLVLARAILSVNFQPGQNLEYHVCHVKSYHHPDSSTLSKVAVSLARELNVKN